MIVNIPGGYTSVNVLKVKLGSQQNPGPVIHHVSGKTNSGTLSPESFRVSGFVQCLLCTSIACALGHVHRCSLSCWPFVLVALIAL